MRVQEIMLCEDIFTRYHPFLFRSSREKMVSHHLQNKRSNKDLEHEINILWRGTKFSSFFLTLPSFNFFSPLSKKDFWRNIYPYMKNVPFFCLKRKKMKSLHILWEWTIFFRVLPRAPMSKFRREKIIFMIFQPCLIQPWLRRFAILTEKVHGIFLKIASN